MTASWTLKKKSHSPHEKGEEISVKMCPECFRSYNPDSYSDKQHCPKCGYVYPKTQREIKQEQEAQLMKIVEAYSLPSECRSLQELHAFAKKKGYKSGWAYHIAKERGFVH